MKSDIICLVYVDYIIIYGSKDKLIEEEIKALVIRQGKQLLSFEIHDEGEVGDFLVIRIEQQKYLKFYQSHQIKLSQHGLTNKVLNLYHIS